MRIQYLSAALLCLTLAACGDGGGSGGGGGTDTGGDGGAGGQPSSGDIGLQVTSAKLRPSIGDVAPSAPDSVFAIVTAGVHNATDDSIPLAAAHFSVTTKDGLEVLSSPQSSLLEGYCPAELSLVAGADHACEVAFEIPSSSVPTTLLYDSGAGIKGSAGITLDPSTTLCGSFCDAAESHQAALGCGNIEIPKCTTSCETAMSEADANGCLPDLQAAYECVTLAPDSEWGCDGADLVLPSSCVDEFQAADACKNGGGG